MKNIEKYPNTNDAMDAYRSLSLKEAPFDEWLEYEYEEPHQLKTTGEPDCTLLEAAEGVMNEWYVMTPNSARTGFVAALSRLSSAIEREKRKPIRNCDVGTVDEQLDRYGLFCQHECPICENRFSCHTCGERYRMKCMAAWAQMPYE